MRVALHLFQPELIVEEAGVVVLMVALGRTLRLAYTRFKKRAMMSRVRARGVAGEARAEQLLVRLGFEILGRQVARRYDVGDGRMVPVDLPRGLPRGTEC